MINCELLLEYVVKSKLHIKDIADKLKLSEINFIKRVGNLQEFTYTEVNILCDVLRIPPSEALNVFFN